MIQEIHHHKIQCGDIMDGVDELMGKELADFIYSDPPWGQGNLRYWQTMNLKMTNVPKKEIVYPEFLEQLFAIISKYAKDRVVIEYGKRWHEDIVNISRQHGFVHNGSLEGFYKAGAKMLPNDFHVLSKIEPVEITEELREKARYLKEILLVDLMFDEFCPDDAQVILDPMCGMGNTAQICVNKGYQFRGNELNQKRLDKTIARLKSENIH